MPVMIKVHSFSAVQFAEVVDMPTPEILVVKTVNGRTHKIHVSLVKKFL